MKSYWEKLYPLAFAATLMSISYLYSADILEWLRFSNLKLISLLSGLVTIWSVLIGFLITFYAILLTADIGLIREMRRTTLFPRFIGYCWFAMITSTIFLIFNLAAASLTVEAIFKATLFDFGLAIWSGLFVMSILGIYRVLRHVRALLETPVQKRPKAG